MAFDTSNTTPRNFDKLQIYLGATIVVAFAGISFVITNNLIRIRAESIATPLASIELSEAALENPSSGPKANSDVDILRQITSIPVTLPGSRSTLARPRFSVEGGTYEKSKFPLKIWITNPNETATWTMVSLNNSGFREFSGGRTVSINPGDSLHAYIRGDTEKWVSSDIEKATYREKFEPKPMPRPVSRFRDSYRR